MLYQKNQERELKRETFQDPPQEYRGAPFWAWNCKVTEQDADAVLTDLKHMGMGGAHIHSRTGMDLPYLSEEYMDMAAYALEKGKSLGMKTWLYDEDRFPSGAAGGMVTKENRYRQRWLVLSPETMEEKKERLVCLGKYAVRLENGYLKSYRFLKKEEENPQNEDIWYLYREVAENDPWFNNQSYVDTLNPEAIRRFIQITHEAYYERFGDEFGKAIPAIFTDEPQFRPKSVLHFAEERTCVILPYTDDFPDTYREAYGCEFLESLPECVWELPNGEISVKRYQYHDHICERFTEAFADQIGRWCRAHGIALTGHMMEEPTLASQTAMLGEAMRSYRSFEIPGIDMLYDSRELNTAKQAQSAVHQYGREAMLSELYGVTGWDFDFRGHKLAGDWQAALGVTVRVHHLTWTSMAGEAKRDYPASIGYQSPWYREYSVIEDYFARLNTALTRGNAEVRVGVIHPIESYWLCWGPREQTQERREEMDHNFKQLTEWLLYGLLDFDFICESLWKDQTADSELDESKWVSVGKMKYDVILVPGCITLRSSTLKRLKKFKEKGGRVIFAGEIPQYIDAVKDSRIGAFADSCEKIPFSKCAILNALEPVRTVDVRLQSGERTGNIVSQIRRDGDRKWLFLAHCMPMINPDLPQREQLTVRFKGIYRPLQYDAMTGEIREVDYAHENGNTCIEAEVFDHDSLLFCLESVKSKKLTVEKRKERRSEADVLSVPDFVRIEREEPNVLILDIADGRIDGGEWIESEEVLRLDNKFRRYAGYPLRTEAFPQPWTAKQSEKPEHTIQVRFRIYSEIPLDTVWLALEHADKTRLWWNKEEITEKPEGYYVDRSIRKVRLPDLRQGENILIAEMPYYHRFNMEAMYILGEFGVRVWGRTAVIEKKRDRIAFGDLCVQGFPFYGGNLTYKIPIELNRDGTLQVEATQFRSPLIKVKIDGRECGAIAFSPYCITIPGMKRGRHILELTAFGSRNNTFGALHNCNRTEPWRGHPNSYRTTGAAWAYEYQLKTQGILVSPVILYRKS